ARLAASLLRYAHRDDVAWLPVGVHLLRRGDELGARISRALGALRARRAGEPAAAPAREDGASEGRHLHHQQEAGDRAVPRYPRAQAELPLELRHARGRLERGAALRDAPRRVPALEP